MFDPSRGPLFTAAVDLPHATEMPVGVQVELRSPLPNPTLGFDSDTPGVWQGEVNGIQVQLSEDPWTCVGDYRISLIVELDGEDDVRGRIDSFLHELLADEVCPGEASPPCETSVALTGHRVVADP